MFARRTMHLDVPCSTIDEYLMFARRTVRLDSTLDSSCGRITVMAMFARRAVRLDRRHTAAQRRRSTGGNVCETNPAPRRYFAPYGAPSYARDNVCETNPASRPDPTAVSAELL